ncbi:peptidoglycan-binding protein [Microbacterium sp. Au-Mic1]|uniref:peptidoglycan-binding domain-containing protein n=1 Tax=Microbacterium sp. Au-Mic1 TaxID=2906457 RepID=UPI001E408DD5|nr:peptidoglycan-binding protein [Microbacterium sp. Au-Mic1]MCE4024971.1 peptidoglycan-binding protein [Microbacterium sp. Au-Mic1]
MNTEPWGTLQEPSSDSRVTPLQYLLSAQGHAVPITGSFDGATTAAVKAVQAAAGLVQDGVVGIRTWRHLVVPLQAGSTGDAVRALQSFGLREGPGSAPLVVDGGFGPITDARVRSFQASWGLAIDGIVGGQTWSFLMADHFPSPWALVIEGAVQAVNSHVLAAQHLLRAHGATIAADGAFFALSGAALEDFQRTIRSTEIGTTVGQLDWPHLIMTVQLGSTGEAVMALQSQLPGLTVDGVFGPVTDAAVRDFQAKFAPPADGIAGPDTWHSLFVPLFD